VLDGQGAKNKEKEYNPSSLWWGFFMQPCDMKPEASNPLEK
jgi:hypothetical protein